MAYKENTEELKKIPFKDIPVGTKVKTKSPHFYNRKVFCFGTQYIYSQVPHPKEYTRHVIMRNIFGPTITEAIWKEILPDVEEMYSPIKPSDRIKTLEKQNLEKDLLIRDLRKELSLHRYGVNNKINQGAE